VDAHGLRIVGPRRVGAGASGTMQAKDRAQRRPFGPAQEQLLGRRRGDQVVVAPDVGAVAVGAVDGAAEHVGGQRGQAGGGTPVGGLVAGKVAALVGGRSWQPRVARARVEERSASGMLALIAGELLARGPGIKYRIAIVHRRPGLTVV